MQSTATACKLGLLRRMATPTVDLHTCTESADHRMVKPLVDIPLLWLEGRTSGWNAKNVHDGRIINHRAGEIVE